MQVKMMALQPSWDKSKSIAPIFFIANLGPFLSRGAVFPCFIGFESSVMGCAKTNTWHCYEVPHRNSETFRTLNGQLPALAELKHQHQVQALSVLAGVVHWLNLLISMLQALVAKRLD